MTFLLEKANKEIWGIESVLFTPSSLTNTNSWEHYMQREPPPKNKQTNKQTKKNSPLEVQDDENVLFKVPP